MHAQALSRAFRSRFLELHVGDIPDAELATILQQRCALAPSYSAKLVAVMRELQRRRQVCCPNGTACKALTISLGRVDIKLQQHRLLACFLSVPENVAVVSNLQRQALMISCSACVCPSIN